MFIQLPNDVVVNMDNVAYVAAKDNVILFYAVGGSLITSYPPTGPSDASNWLGDIMAAASNTTLSETSSATPTISAVSPSSVVGSANSTLTITIANVITQTMIDDDDVQVYVDGSLAGIQSKNLTTIVITMPTLVAHAPATIQIWQASTATLLKADSTLLTIT